MTNAITLIARENAKPLAAAKAKELSEKYNVAVAIAETDTLFSSDEAMRYSIENKTYLISNENPEKSAAITEYSIRRHQFTMQWQHANRVGKARDNSQRLRATIEDFITVYSETHGGRSPSLNHIAAHLNENKMPSPSGNDSTKWYAQTVRRLLDQTNAIQR